jgi:hypothetical protein
MKKVFGLILFMLGVCTHPAFAWPQCNGNWNQVPAGTSSAGGAIYTADGLTWQCQPKTPTTPSSTGGNSNANSVATATSSSTAASQSASNSSATGGKSSSISSATGGNATGGNSYSGVSNSGNSSVSNSVNATGGAGGNATASATNNGNGANNSTYSSTTNVAASKIPVATAIAPPSGSANTCFKGFGGGVQSALLGASFGGGKIDTNCAILEAARLAPSLLARCKVYLSDKYVKAAGVTLDDCLADQALLAVASIPAEPAPAPVPAQQTIVLPAPQVTINLPAPVLSTLAPPIVNHKAPIDNHPAVKKHRPQKPCDATKPTVWDNDRLESLPYTHTL